MRLLAFLLALFAASAALAVSPDELLEPEKAFRISARALDERHVEVQFRIAPGYYMYRDRFSFATESGTLLGEAELPRGIPKEDQFFGRTETFRDLVQIKVPVTAEDAARGRVNLKVTSQGCSDKGVCYTPLEQIVRVALPGAGGEARATPLAAPLGALRVPWLLLVASLTGALALGWVAAGAPMRREATAVSFARPGLAVRGAGLAVLGAAAGWVGGASEVAWTAAPIALAFLVLAALWMHWSMHRGAARPRELALLVAVLLVALKAGDAWFGAAAGLGAGLTLPFFRKSQAAEGPREAALQAVALAMLAAAVWSVAPLLPTVFRMLAWSAWLIIAGTLLRALDPLPEHASWLARLAKAAGVGLLVWGVAVLTGALSGGNDPLRPFEALQASSRPAAEAPLKFERVATLPELEARVAYAGRPVMLDFYADWCVSCKEMEQFTFTDPDVRARMARLLLLQADVTRNTEDDKALLRRFQLFGPPGIIFFNARGEELRGLRVVGYQPPERFSRVLDEVLGKDRQ